MVFFILGSDMTSYAAVGDLAILGNLVPVDEETCVNTLDIYDSLE